MRLHLIFLELLSFIAAIISELLVGDIRFMFANSCDRNLDLSGCEGL